MSNLALKQSAFAGLKRDFDIPLSKKLCPPVLNNQGQTFEKRIVTLVDNIIDYFETPFEIEAYGREKGLLVAFLARWSEIEEEMGLNV